MNMSPVPNCYSDQISYRSSAGARLRHTVTSLLLHSFSIWHVPWILSHLSYLFRMSENISIAIKGSTFQTNFQSVSKLFNIFKLSPVCCFSPSRFCILAADLTQLYASRIIYECASIRAGPSLHLIAHAVGPLTLMPAVNRTTDMLLSPGDALWLSIIFEH